MKPSQVLVLLDIAEAAQAFYVALVDSEGPWNVEPATSEWLALQDALTEAANSQARPA